MACSKSQTHFEGKKTKDVSEKENKTYIENQTSFKSMETRLTDLKNVFMRLPVNITENKLINKHRLHSKFLQIPVKSLQVFQRDVNLNFSAFRDKSTLKITFI